MSDSTILLRDIAGDAAQNAATRINPSEDRLSQIDHAAEDNTWHDVPNLSPANLKAQAKDQYSKNKPFSKGDMQSAADQANATGQTADGVDARAGAGTAAGNLRDQASANVPQETKDRAQEATDKATDKANDLQGRTKNYIGTKLPKERREQSIYRLKKMIVEIQGHSDCRRCSLSPVSHGLTTSRSTSN